jgi:hypothetical protein
MIKFRGSGDSMHGLHNLDVAEDDLHELQEDLKQENYTTRIAKFRMNKGSGNDTDQGIVYYT